MGNPILTHVLVNRSAVYGLSDPVGDEYIGGAPALRGTYCVLHPSPARARWYGTGLFELDEGTTVVAVRVRR